MAHKVVLTLADGSVVQSDSTTHNQPTPKVGDIIEVRFDIRVVRARVKGVITRPEVDMVMAQELQK